MRTYVSCNCRHCRRVSAAVRGHHKKVAHRALRQAARRALRNGTEAPLTIATGYKD